MLSLLGLLVRLLVASRRTLAGWVVYLAGLGVLYAVPGPLDELCVATSVALVAVTIWVVVSGFVSDRSTTMILCAAAGGPLRFHLAQATAGLAAAARPVTHDVAVSLTVAVGGFVLVTVAPSVSPLAPTLHNVTSGSDSIGAAAAWCLAAAGWASLLAVVGGAVAARRRSYGSAAPR